MGDSLTDAEERAFMDAFADVALAAAVEAGSAIAVEIAES
jgi:hypothetical protein